MKVKDILTEDQGFRRSIGLTDITQSRNNLVISHGGNMGDREFAKRGSSAASVQADVDRLLGPGAFKYLRKHGDYHRDKYNVYTDPSSMYILLVPMEYYYKWMALKERRAGKGKARVRESVLKDTAVYYVHVPANIYDGKYYDARTVRVPVAASSVEEATDMINTHKNAVLDFIEPKRMRVGNRTVRYVQKPVERNVFFKPYYSARRAPVGEAAVALTHNGRFERVVTNVMGTDES